MTLEIDVLTLFPSMVPGPLGEHPRPDPGAGHRHIRVHDLREWGLGRHGGRRHAVRGGAGMVMRVEPVVAAIEAVNGRIDRHPARPGRGDLPAGTGADLADASAPRPRLPAIRGRRRSGPRVRRPGAVDRRLRADGRRAARAGRHRRRDPPAARARSTTSPRRRSRSARGSWSIRSTHGPPTFRGMDVPEILTSGDHGAVAAGAHDQSLRRTRDRRPDLLG
jgi:tRNA (guanine37-N1)-methyltransferase